MARRGLVGAIGTAALAGLLAACAPPDAPAPGAAADAAALRLRFEDVLVPAAFSRVGPAVIEGHGGAAGLWAVAPGLPRPERARVEDLATGATVDVALFAGAGAAGAIRLSSAAGEVLGLGPGPAQVRVTALRREPRIAPP